MGSNNPKDSSTVKIGNNTYRTSGLYTALSSASKSPKTAIEKNVPKAKGNPISMSGRTLVSSTRKVVSENNDTGSDVVGGVISAGSASYMTFRGAQSISNVSVKTASAVMKPPTLSSTKRLLGNSPKVRKTPFGVIKSSGKWTVKRGASGALNVTSGALSSSEDNMLRGIGYTTKTTRVAVKTGVETTRLTKNAVKKVYSGSKFAYNSMQYVRKKGLRKAWAQARKKTANAVARSGKSVVSATLNGIKKLGLKLLLPLVLAVGMCAFFVSGAGSAATVVSYYVTGEFIVDFFNGANSSDLADGVFLRAKLKEDYVPLARKQGIEDLCACIEDAFGKNAEAENVEAQTVLLTYSNKDVVYVVEKDTLREVVDETFYTEEETLALVESVVFSASLYASMEEKTFSDADIADIMRLFVCSEPYTDENGNITVHCSADSDKYLNLYFIEPISKLEAKASLTTEETIKLAKLRDYYDIYKEMIGFQN